MSIADKVLQLKNDFDNVYKVGEGKGFEIGYDYGYYQGEKYGYAKGFEAGSDDVYEAAYNEGYQAQYDVFWDAYQNNGQRKLYSYAFCNADPYGRIAGNWDENTLIPKYPIKPGNDHESVYVFTNVTIEDFKAHCIKNGIIIDLSECQNLGNFYRGIKTKYIPDMDISSCTTIGSCFYDCTELIEAPRFINGNNVTNSNRCFYNCKKLETIPVLYADNVTEFTYVVYNCIALKNITIDGAIGVDISFQHSPLTTASIVNIIEHLSLSKSATLTLNATAKEGMVFPYTSPQTNITYNSWDELIATKNNWTISLV